MYMYMCIYIYTHKHGSYLNLLISLWSSPGQENTFRLCVCMHVCLCACVPVCSYACWYVGM